MNELSSNNKPLVNNENSSKMKDCKNQYSSDNELPETAFARNFYNSDAIQIL